MAQTTKKKVTNKKSRSIAMKRAKVEKDLSNEIILIITVAIGSLITFCVYAENVGVLGGFIGGLLRGLLGIGAYIIPVIIIAFSIYLLFEKNNRINGSNVITFSFIMWVFISVVHINNKVLISPESNELFIIIEYYFLEGSWNNGGVLGALLGGSLINLIGIYSTYICLYSSLLILIMLFTRKPIFKSINTSVRKNYNKTKKYVIDTKAKIDENRTYRLEEKRLRQSSYNMKIDTENNYEEDDIIEDTIIKKIVKDPEIKPFSEIEIKKENKKRELLIGDNTINEDTENKFYEDEDFTEGPQIVIDGKKMVCYRFPSIDFLNRKPLKSNDTVKIEIEMKENAIKLEKTLKSFGVEATVLDVCKGPAVTRYELQPKEGVKVSKIVNLSDDIALNLAASGLRIEAPIPGKAAIGIEIPNNDIQTVYLREIIESKEFKNFKSKLAFGVGKDISGNIMVADISKMPHTLIAGATGSGKSVCINTIITSILYKADPREVKLIMIDPKVVELSVYNGIPHLLIPVVTDPKKAAGALSWAVQEMIRRYKLFAEHNVRDIKGYNEHKTEKFETDFMPHMVIIIDELADLMMASPKDVEDSICRLAQMARAAGMHLIIATQRPSVDVITGVIKANIPSRIAFSVSSGIDSRTILDMVGAEKLMGKGDMLFYPSGMPKPIRIQGAFISDKEVEKIVEFIKTTSEAEYNEEIIEKISESKIQFPKIGK